MGLGINPNPKIMGEKARWYVVHTYSGYENKVKANIEKTIENRNIHDLIYDIQVPMEEEIEEKDGKKKVTLKKVFPGYVLIKMIMTDDSWYVVRNTRGVTGFVGPGSKPVALTDEEVDSMGIVEKPVKIDIEVGESVKVISGPLENQIALVQEITEDKQRIKGLVNMFGRETPVELEFNQIQKLD
ncbi:transcription termination/antitermination factor NusG [Clostridium pasteurianum BC1]|uniref:Transcription termination/antitermination protein NusG n=2 Tax=Clostridium pasteurianum TaxID=1501 RepID=R4KHZ3_CLOPA|nr:transcription termination/antitermination factor NusG [Clostridium pasteurianum BC1]